MRRANSRLNSAVRAPPMCRKPVGDGAKRVTTFNGGLSVTPPALDTAAQGNKVASAASSIPGAIAHPAATAATTATTATTATAARARAAVARGAAALEAFLDAQRAQLPLWIPVALGAGIAAWFLLPGRGEWLAFAAAALALAAAGIALRGWTGRALAIGGLLAATGLGLAWNRSNTVAAPRLAHEIRMATIEARITAREDREGRGQWRLHLRPDTPALPPLIRISVRHEPDARMVSGARIRARISLRPPPGPSVPGGYDFARRLWFEGVGATGFTLGDPVLIAPAPPPTGWRAHLDGTRAYLTARLKALVGGPEGALAAALVTGDDGGIPAPVRQAMTDAGLAHIISISGLHIAVVIALTMTATRRLFALSAWMALHWPVRTIAAAVAALTGIAYTLLAGGEVPTVRSVLAALVVLAGLVAGRTAFSLRGIAAGAFVILLFRPEALLGPSFQLSFAAVTALVAAMASPWGRRLAARREGEGWARRRVRDAATLVASGTVAQLALLPIALYHFNREGVFGMLANLVGIPLSEFVIMPALMLTLALDTLGLAAPAVWLLKGSIAELYALADTVAALPHAVFRLPTMGLPAYALFVLGGLWLCLWEGRARLIGLAPALAGAALALAARAPDLVVSGDGRHLGVLRRDGAMALLRPQAGDFIRGMWGDWLAAGRTLPLDEVASASCSPDACVLLLDRGGRPWRVFATRSRRLVDRSSMAAQCAAADIVVSERRLPPWCRPRWLRLDAAHLARTGAVAVWLDGPHVATAAAAQGAHPWAYSSETSILTGSSTAAARHASSTPNRMNPIQRRASVRGKRLARAGSSSTGTDAMASD